MAALIMEVDHKILFSCIWIQMDCKGFSIICWMYLMVQIFFLAKFQKIGIWRALHKYVYRMSIKPPKLGGGKWKFLKSHQNTVYSICLWYCSSQEHQLTSMYRSKNNCISTMILNFFLSLLNSNATKLRKMSYIYSIKTGFRGNPKKSFLNFV